MESVIYGIVVAVAAVFFVLGGYFWYLTPGRRDHIE
jgi:hypothetical protein